MEVFNEALKSKSILLACLIGFVGVNLSKAGEGVRIIPSHVLREAGRSHPRASLMKSRKKQSLGISRM